MTVLGLAGGFDLVYTDEFQFPYSFAHDSAAVLLQNGRVVAAVEEERLNRIKHTNKLWTQAVACCLREGRVRLADVECIAFYCSESWLDAVLHEGFLFTGNRLGLLGARRLLQFLFEREFGERLPPDRFRFVPHHRAHAVSAHWLSGAPDSLVLTLDGFGDDVSGSVNTVRNDVLERLRTFSVAQSLGHYYLAAISVLGYRLFDEYKVMGLAPYGNPATFRALFRRFYTLGDGGDYTIHADAMKAIFDVCPVRTRGEDFQQPHKDVAAALQESLETIVLHVLRHYRSATGLTRLCLAGGVAQNSSLNGRILASGLFDDVFVQPAAYDAGCALGAAMDACLERGVLPNVRLEHVYWGTAIAGGADLERELRAWHPLVTFRRLDDPAAETARLLADGAVVGWAQGRAEFGARALGHRSILADPRPASNKDVINAMVKKRESYRPFAPAVLEEHVHEYFDLPAHVERLPFMTFVVPVKEHWRPRLGAITHEDGTARVQTVGRSAAPAFRALLDRFRALTGLPMLLNTSFNNNVEPIVNDARDAVTCFLTSGLHYLVIGDCLVQKRPLAAGSLAEFAIELPAHVLLRDESRMTSAAGRRTALTISSTCEGGPSADLSPATHGLLRRCDGRRTIAHLVDAGPGEPAVPEPLQTELMALLGLRLIRLIPPAREVDS
ncbi:MAG TPA: carbamoyltransferase C-terminal domain-containing protein [Vicinamibacterales bacterium]|nr:carbamoyltransferase C-terminal domain-containing protein [Vicinamibacterales bacterium]